MTPQRLTPLVFSLQLDGALPDPRPAAFAAGLQAECAQIDCHRFPDGESLVRLPLDPAGRDVLLFAPLERPDAKLLPLLCAADAARELGAHRVALVAPYLPYMRQDRRFQSGQAISAHTFAAVLSAHFDYLMTVDPHLHRITSLAEVFRIETAVVSAAPRVAAWIQAHVERPWIIGPDGESRQWAQAVAESLGAPYEVLGKVRRGDRDVSLSPLSAGALADSGHRLVLVDDIVASARTMIEAVQQIRAAGLPAPICVGVHAVLAEGALEALEQAGAAGFVSCNTVAHASNRIDVLPDWVRAVTNWLHGGAPQGAGGRHNPAP